VPAQRSWRVTNAIPGACDAAISASGVVGASIAIAPCDSSHRR
jgi:hypothetical protein